MARTKIPHVDKTALSVLTGYEWPGNVRELRNVLERALILCGKSDIITQEHLGVAYQVGFGSVRSRDLFAGAGPPKARSFQEALSETKRTLIEEALKSSKGSIKQAALLLGITRDSLVHYMKSLSLNR